MQHGGAVAREELDRFPHDQIAAPKFLQKFIRRAEFVERTLAEVEKNCRCDGLRPTPCNGDEPPAGFDDLSLYIEEEGQRLRRKTMAPARSCMQTVEFQESVTRFGNLDVQSTLFRLTYRATRGACHPGK